MGNLDPGAEAALQSFLQSGVRMHKSFPSSLLHHETNSKTMKKQIYIFQIQTALKIISGEYLIYPLVWE